MKITIREIAKEANVSVATVSRCINNKGYVHEDTKKVIEEIVKKSGYVPNQLARLLLKRRSSIIGVIIPHTVAPFIAELIDGIENEAMANGLKVMLCITNNNVERELDYIKVFEDYVIDGLIICSNFFNVEKVMNLSIPIVSIDHILDPSIPSITTDNIEGGRLAAEKLIECGAKNFVLFRGPSFLITTSERTLGFTNVLKKYGIGWDFHDFDLVAPDSSFIYNYLLNNPQIDGIFTTSDTLGVIVTGILNKLGRKLGEDVFLVSFDGLPISRWVYPALTTINQPIQYMGVEAVNTLMKLIDGKEIPEQHRIIQISLKERDSTKHK
jgi:DNA-binding LacI/PurR family transcriptional regulator